MLDVLMQIGKRLLREIVKEDVVAFQLAEGASVGMRELFTGH
jgi:hypothetical protein